MQNNETTKNNKFEEISLLEYYYTIRRNIKMIILIVFFASVLAVVVSLLLTEEYYSTALIVPVGSGQKSGGLSSLMGQFSGLASLAGVNLSSGDTKFVAILNSRTLTENVIKSEHLMPVLFSDKWDEKAKQWKLDDPEQKPPSMQNAVDRMKGSLKIKQDEIDTTIKIGFTFTDPDVAARIVNAYVRELQRFIDSKSLTTAKKHRVFMEMQVAENKKELLEIGKEINAFYQKKSNASSGSILDVSILKKERNKAQSKDIEKLLIEKENNKKKIQEAKVVKNVPQGVYLEYLLTQYQLLLQIQMTLSSQYEMAKVQESKEDLSFSIIDKAIAPEMRAFPKRAKICIASFFGAIVFAVLLAFIKEYLARSKKITD